jgi:preprotein translocase subunit SecA
MDLTESDIKELHGNSNTGELKPDDVLHQVIERAHKLYAEKVKTIGEEKMADIERYFFIQSIDYHWKENLLALDHLKEGIHLRGYAQKDPLVEYRKEGFNLFKVLDKTIRQTALTRLYTFRIMSPEEEEARRREELMRRLAVERQMSFSGPEEADGDHTPRPKTPAETAKPSPAQNPGIAAALNFLKDRQSKRTGPNK